MAITRSNSGLDAVFDAGRTFFNQKMDHMRRAQAKRRVYRATYHEFSVLTDRDLKDLGIPRSNIKRLAMEAAYGC
ncbi:DUF1127 domain-containing protein [Roseobacter litoralis]|uniref:YjiS-like domain-containing protein n=1 Tax=Roseobacter litoralis (strain ATCC 49566 / DSM 6996 / JCM 21268 / NBRC 15278 / OCh 149) TaxID=391595 RepID=F7ZEK0_ROSLO|nr:hypothetical protein DUF1127 [Roseobacter litoralis Och 149]